MLVGGAKYDLTGASLLGSSHFSSLLDLAGGKDRFAYPAIHRGSPVAKVSAHKDEIS